MVSGLFDRIPVEDMDDAYVARLRHLRWLMFAVCALVFATIIGIELASAFQASFAYLFALALTVLISLFASDAISGRVDAYEAEKEWRAAKGNADEI